MYWQGLANPGFQYGHTHPAQPGTGPQALWLHSGQRSHHCPVLCLTSDGKEDSFKLGRYVCAVLYSGHHDFHAASSVGSRDEADDGLTSDDEDDSSFDTIDSDSEDEEDQAVDEEDEDDEEEADAEAGEKEVEAAVAEAAAVRQVRMAAGHDGGGRWVDA